MIVEICGRNGDWFTSIDEGDNPENRPNLLPCPFCGADGEELEICNTHTSSYWIDCKSCGGSVHPGPPIGHLGNKVRTKAAALELHGKALAKVVGVWNTRYPQGGQK